MSGPHGDAYDDSLAAVAGALADLVDRQPAASRTRRAAARPGRTVAARPALAAGFFELYRAVLLRGYRRLEERLDVPSWATVQVTGLTDPAAVAERFDFLSGACLFDLIRGAYEAPGEQLLAPRFPLFSEVLGQAIDRLFGIAAIEDRFAVCLFFLKDDALGYRQKEAMVELLGVVKEMMQPDRRTDVNRILSRLTAFFRDRDNQFLLMRFKCYEAIGVAIGEASNVQAVDHLVEDVLSWRFQYPDIQGATDEWGTMVNPYHLPKIRCWMRIISRTRRSTSASPRPSTCSFGWAACTSPTPTSSSATSRAF